ncbi:hypothetical protein AB1Y20_009668 [Prymnesium parvum]|uniref:Methyltransferase domain-containing protein n=1 Tax=Prymnesium parvum TaxID=97485 RepID=A0AB34K4Y1_PRYPA
MLSAAWRSFDARPTLSREEARAVYDRFAEVGHIGGEDVSSGYGGPAVHAILRIAGFADCRRVLEFGCGQGKLAQLVLDADPKLEWHALDQSPRMVERARARLSPYGSRCTVSLLASGAPRDAAVAPRSVDRVVSTYCLDLMSEEDMYGVLDLAERSLHPGRGLLILSGITWGYRDSFRTFFMTLVWELN